MGLSLHLNSKHFPRKSQSLEKYITSPKVVLNSHSDAYSPTFYGFARKCYSHPSVVMTKPTAARQLSKLAGMICSYTSSYSSFSHRSALMAMTGSHSSHSYGYAAPSCNRTPTAVPSAPSDAVCSLCLLLSLS